MLKLIIIDVKDWLSSVCQGKTNEHIKKIYLSLANNNKSLLLTRANRDIFDLLHKIDNRIKYNELSRTISLEVSKNKKGLVLLFLGADIPVADEAAETQTFVEQILKKYMMLGCWYS